MLHGDTGPSCNYMYNMYPQHSFRTLQFAIQSVTHITNKYKLSRITHTASKIKPLRSQQQWSHWHGAHHLVPHDPEHPYSPFFTFLPSHVTRHTHRMVRREKACFILSAIVVPLTITNNMSCMNPFMLHINVSVFAVHLLPKIGFC